MHERRWLKTKDPADLKSIFAPTAYVLSQLPIISKRDGVQGYWYTYPNETWFLTFHTDRNAGIESAKKTWNPILEKIAIFPGVQKPITQYTNFPNFKSMFDALLGPLEAPISAEKRSLPVMHPMMKDPDIARFRRHTNELEEVYPRGIIGLDSRLLGEKHLSSPQLEAALRDSMPQGEYGMLRGHLMAGNQVLKTGVNETSVNPSWRSAWIHLIGTGEAPNITAVKNLAPDMGCYANEVNLTVF